MAPLAPLVPLAPMAPLVPLAPLAPLVPLAPLAPMVPLAPMASRWRPGQYGPKADFAGKVFLCNKDYFAKGIKGDMPEYLRVCMS